MNQVYYPARLFPGDAAGVFCVTVPGINVNAQGGSMDEALQEAGVILQEVINDLYAMDHPIPGPGSAEDTVSKDGQIVLIQTTLPAQAA